MHELLGKEVEVITMETVYSGVLVEVGEKEIYLQSRLGWIPVPVEKITGVREVENQ